jgi:RNA polymerase sigma factor (sigma-70 family)
MTDPPGRTEYFKHMSDSEVVASIVAGNPEGLAAAYDRYAGDLYGYCRSLLQEPNDAADAVQDTFVIAASKLAGLRDPERLRAWLFAVARNECLHRLKARHAAAPLQDAPELADDSVDVGGAAERAETAALLRAAVGGLNDGERDVINQLWHGLEVPEVAAVLGVSRNHAYTLFSRARDQLAASVAVLLVGRAGRRDCATLDSLLGDWDGRLTALLRKRVGRHIDRCEVCSDRRRRELSPSLLYWLTPGALLALTAARKLSWLAGQPGGALSGTRDAVLRLAADPAAHAAAAGRAAGRSAHSFGMNGFPKPPHHGYLGITAPHLPFTVAGGTAISAAAVVVTVVVPHAHPAHRPPGGGPAPGAPAGGVAAPVASGFAGGGPASGGGRPTAKSAPLGVTAAAPRSPAAGGTVTGSATTGSATAGSATTGGAATGGAATGSAITGGATTAPGGTAATGPADGPGPGTPATTATGPTATGLLTAGTVSVSPTTVLLSPLLGGSLTLTATGGPVSWSIAEPASLLGELTVTPASGTLSAGGSVTVTITVAVLASLDTQLTVQPGGQAVTVLLGLG